MTFKDISLVTNALSDYVDNYVSIAFEHYSIVPEKDIRLRLQIGTATISRLISMNQLVSVYSADDDIGMILCYMLMEYFDSNSEFYPDGYEGWCEHLKKFMEDQNETI